MPGLFGDVAIIALLLANSQLNTGAEHSCGLVLQGGHHVGRALTATTWLRFVVPSSVWNRFIMQFALLHFFQAAMAAPSIIGLAFVFYEVPHHPQHCSTVQGRFLSHTQPQWSHYCADTTITVLCGSSCVITVV